MAEYASSNYKWNPEDPCGATLHAWVTWGSGHMTVEIWDGWGNRVREWDMGVDYTPVLMSKLGDMVRENPDVNPVEHVQAWMRKYLKVK